LNVDGLLGAEPPLLGAPNGFVVAGGAPNEKAFAGADVVVLPNEKEPVVEGLCTSSFCCPKLNDVVIAGTALLNPPNPFGSSSLFSLWANGLVAAEEPKLNDEGAAKGDVLADPNNDPPPVEVAVALPMPNENAPFTAEDVLFPLICCISLVGLSSILNSLSLFLGGVTGRSVGGTWLGCPNMNDLLDTSAEVLPPPPPKLKATGAVGAGAAAVGCPKENGVAGLSWLGAVEEALGAPPNENRDVGLESGVVVAVLELTPNENEDVGLGSTTGVVEALAPNEKAGVCAAFTSGAGTTGAMFEVDPNENGVLTGVESLAGVCSKENALPLPLPKSGLGASAVEGTVAAVEGAPKKEGAAAGVTEATLE